MTIRRFQFRYALLLLLASCEGAFSYSPSLVTEHDWTFYIDDYAFGFAQEAPIVMRSNPFMPEQVIMPRTIWIYFGHWSTSIEAHDAPTLAAATTAVISLGALA